MGILTFVLTILYAGKHFALAKIMRLEKQAFKNPPPVDISPRHKIVRSRSLFRRGTYINVVEANFHTMEITDPACWLGLRRMLGLLLCSFAVLPNCDAP